MVSYLVERAQPIVSEGSKSSVSKAKTYITWITVSLMPFGRHKENGRYDTAFNLVITCLIK